MLSAFKILISVLSHKAVSGYAHLFNWSLTRENCLRWSSNVGSLTQSVSAVAIWEGRQAFNWCRLSFCTTVMARKLRFHWNKNMHKVKHNIKPAARSGEGGDSLSSAAVDCRLSQEGEVVVLQNRMR